LDRKTSDKLKKAHQDWKGKFIQAQKEAGQRVDSDAAGRRAAKHVERVERDMERKR
jgi:hypothetical protein